MSDTAQPAPGPTPNPGIRYTLTRGDLLRAVLHQVLRNRVFIAVLIVGSTLVAALWLRQPEIAARSLVFKGFFVVFFDVVFIALATLFALIVLWLTILARKVRGVLCDHTLEVTDTGLVRRTDVNETLHRWSAFHKVVRSRRYLHIYVTDALVHNVPLRSFASEDQVRDFLGEIDRRRARA